MIYYYFTCKLYINIIKEHVRSNHYYILNMKKKLNNRKVCQTDIKIRILNPQKQ